MCEIHTATENRRIEEQEAIQRNEFAFKYLKKVYDFKNDDDVYDVIQDANVVFYKKICQPDFILRSSLSNFFIGICKNVAMNFFSRNKRHSTDAIDKLDDLSSRHSTDAIDKLDNLSSRRSKDLVEKLMVTNSPERILIMNEKKKYIHELLKNMPGHCHKLLWNHYGLGFSWRELACEVDLANENSAKTSGFRCMERFRRVYNERLKDAGIIC